RHRHELFDDELQAELAEMYSDSPKGQPPVPPALLAMVTILQAADGVSDEGAVSEAAFDLRWQMVLDCVGAESAPFSQGVLVEFRKRLMTHGLHERLVAKSVELAKKTGGFGYKNLRVALDSAPLWGAGRVEDTFNLIGHALEVVVVCTAAVVGRPQAEIRDAAGLTLIGRSSVKAALDIDWDDPEEQQRALGELVGEVERLRTWVDENLTDDQKAVAPLQEALDQLERVLAQDLEPDPSGQGKRITRGTAKERQISISDPSMRHGRKSRSTTIKGFKRFIAKELDHGLILGVTVQPANQAERDATATLRTQVERFGPTDVLFIDRGFLASDWTAAHHAGGGRVVCRPWVPRNGDLFSKRDFTIDVDKSSIACPAEQVMPITGPVVRFPKSACARCALRSRCTRAKNGRGRTISIHPQEDLLQELAVRKTRSEGRAELRERVPVEHSLAHICNRQGRRARYRGIDKNILDLCRYAVIENCFAADRMERAA
ncbi:MAG: transposase, partial [Myxococcales bacterium]|nr:transposase [Myxococcales bacterium]